MGQEADSILKLVSDISKVNAESLLIRGDSSPAMYFDDGMSVDPLKERTRFVGIPSESVLDAIRLLIDKEVMDDFIDEVEQAGTTSQTVGLREAVIKVDDEYFRLTFSKRGGNIMAYFRLLDNDRTSKWEPALEQLSLSFVGGTKLSMGNRYGKADLDLSSGQFNRLKAFLLELEQENFAPAESGNSASGLSTL